MKQRLVVAFVTAVLALSALGGPAGAQQYPPSSGTITIDRSAVGPGEQITVAAGGFRPHAAVSVTLEPGRLLLGTVTADPDGWVRAVLGVSGAVDAGAHRLVARGDAPDGTRRALDTSLRVEGDVAAPAPAATAAPARRAPETRDGEGSRGVALYGTLAVLAVAIVAVRQMARSRPSQ